MQWTYGHLGWYQGCFLMHLEWFSSTEPNFWVKLPLWDRCIPSYLYQPNFVNKLSKVYFFLLHLEIKIPLFFIRIDLLFEFLKMFSVSFVLHRFLFFISFLCSSQIVVVVLFLLLITFAQVFFFWSQDMLCVERLLFHCQVIESFISCSFEALFFQALFESSLIHCFSFFTVS